ncbi:MAG: MBL fold metallo-hydrolase [Pseudonocardiaceae bacterium]
MDVDRLVLTHFHDDHAGGATEVTGWGDIEVLAHARDAPIIRGEQAGPHRTSPKRNGSCTPRSPTRCLRRPMPSRSRAS